MNTDPGRLRRTCLLTALVSLAIPTPGTSARPLPYPVLLTSEARQKGALVHSTTHTRSGHYCATMDADGPGQYPQPVDHDHEQELVLRLGRPDRPEVVTSRLWRIGGGLLTLGPHETMRFTLAPVRSGRAIVGWDVRFEQPGPGDLHVDVTIKWPRGACGSDDGRWRYRVRSLPKA